MSPFDYTMYREKTMNTSLPVKEGEIGKYFNSTINKLCHDKFNVACIFQYISIGLLLTLRSSVILMAGVREGRLTYYYFIILLNGWCETF